MWRTVGRTDRCPRKDRKGLCSGDWQSCFCERCFVGRQRQSPGTTEQARICHQLGNDHSSRRNRFLCSADQNNREHTEILRRNRSIAWRYTWRWWRNRHSGYNAGKGIYVVEEKEVEVGRSGTVLG